MINNPIIQSIFCTPIYINYMNRDFSKKEIASINNLKKETVTNHSNTYTKDGYILNKPVFKNIKKYIEECCKDYLEKIISPADLVKLEVTQSWLNYSDKNQYHQEHSHSNSLVSGVLYVNVHEENDSVDFLDSPYSAISPNIKNFNVWNSKLWTVPVKRGMIIMFPSSINHRVKVNEQDYTRISLAFNTFLRGSLGQGLGKLKI